MIKQQKPKINKTMIAVIVAIIVLAIIYFYFSGGSPSADTNLIQQNGPETIGWKLGFSVC